MARLLTVIDLNDWALLFDDERLVDQSHSFSVGNLVQRARCEPVYLQRICADGSKLDEQLQEDGEASLDMTLTEARAMCGRPA
ncbi:hypothetical protein LB559_09395 [Mesorhizobium sp. BR1-1-3]|uniref:hypothetical protein n=1 Tax=Mesorhizobium sp. BR1-1-3 TaxID=2876651 RepID=UPI001CD1888A|nr:hypothetical protein [Mesorhizobium sp. BR1-1-3]MBZ9888153.1 hypothetical protein [Mesorhizobium sp. BR1-1-3]